MWGDAWLGVLFTWKYEGKGFSKEVFNVGWSWLGVHLLENMKGAVFKKMVLNEGMVLHQVIPS